MHLLVAGIHARPAVASAKRAGHKVSAVDYFGDVDLRLLADSHRSMVEQGPHSSNGRIEENYREEEMLDMAREVEADSVLLTSTMEFDSKKVMGNSPKTIKKLKNKIYQLEKIDSLGIKFPGTETVNSREEAIDVLETFGFPAILKPASGAGGRGVIMVGSASEVPSLEEEYLVQEFIPGTPFSVSTLSTGEDARAFSTSQQIVGSDLVNAGDFIYSGAVVPYQAPPGAEDWAERITLELGFKGWNGVDFVESNGEIYFIEANPRFQGTLDAVERACSTNVVEAHLRACQGELVEEPRPRRHAVRMTLFAKYRSRVRENFLGQTLDVPLKDSIVEGGEPFTTVVEVGKSRREAWWKAKRKVKQTYKKVEKIN